MSVTDVVRTVQTKRGSVLVATELAESNDDVRTTHHRCKKCFLTFCNVFFIFQTFFLFDKNVGKVQSGKHINK